MAETTTLGLHESINDKNDSTYRDHHERAQYNTTNPPTLSGAKDLYINNMQQSINDGTSDNFSKDINSVHVDSQFDRIQEYANSNMGIGMAMRNGKRQQGHHPSARLPSGDKNSSLPPAAPSSRIVMQSARLDNKMSSRENIHGADGFDTVQSLREQNMQMKSKLTQLNLALDKAVQELQQNKNQIGRNNMGSVQSFQSGTGQGSQAENMKLQEINRRLNDLLNQKDEELMSLNQKVFDLQQRLNTAGDSGRSAGGSPMKTRTPAKALSSPKAYIPKGYSVVNKLEDTVADLERQNKQLKKEIQLLNKVQKQQGKELVNLTEEGEIPLKMKQCLDDLRVQKELNKKLKQQMADAEKQSKSSHATVVKLEQTIKELKAAALEQKKQSAKSKQTERLNEAAEKIDELMQANSYLNQAKDSAVKLSGKQRQQYARQMAALHHRIDFLTKILNEHGIEI